MTTAVETKDLRITLRLQCSMREMISAIATERGISASEVIRQLLQQGLENNAPQTNAP